MSSVTHPFFAGFDRVYVINLPSRPDRRREIDRQLQRVGLSLEHPKVKLFDAVRPDDPGGFDSVGARGCFESHQGVLADARRDDLDRVFIFEDDADLTRAFLRDGGKLAGQARDKDWALMYLGYVATPPLPEARPDEVLVRVPPDTHMGMTHSVALDRRGIEKLGPYLAAMHARPSGDPAGGPMQIDGAYSWFRGEHPDLPVLASHQPMAVQRSSRTDIAPTGLAEKVPGIGLLRRVKNKLRRD